jgi:uncharacterized protein (DUF1697 family)
MGSKRYVALLRGINVGGRNQVGMGELREAFESAGYNAVSTYIQSGNVLFESDAARADLEDDIEAALERRFGVPLVVVVRSHQQFRNVVEKAPAGFGDRPDTYHSDAIFLKAPLSSRQAMRIVELREGVDEAWPGTGVLYFRRLSARRVQSRMGRIAGTPEYKLMTIRSWKTTTTLLTLLDEARAGSTVRP